MHVGRGNECYYFMGDMLVETREEKYFGVYISSSLSQNDHVARLVERVNSFRKDRMTTCK